MLSHSLRALLADVNLLSISFVDPVKSSAFFLAEQSSRFEMVSMVAVIRIGGNEALQGGLTP